MIPVGCRLEPPKTRTNKNRVANFPHVTKALKRHAASGGRG